MAWTSASPQPWLNPADAIRRVLNGVFGRRAPQAPRPGLRLPDPPDHTSGLVPEMPDALEWVESRITALADRDKLDPEHGAILDPTVDTMVELWARGLNAKYRAHQARLESAELDLVARESWLQREADRADARISALDSELMMRFASPHEPDEPEAADHGQLTIASADASRCAGASANESTEEAT